jgi:hypothetical protein
MENISGQRDDRIVVIAHSEFEIIASPVQTAVVTVQMV